MIQQLCAHDQTCKQDQRKFRAPLSSVASPSSRLSTMICLPQPLAMASYFVFVDLGYRLSESLFSSASIFKMLYNICWFYAWRNGNHWCSLAVATNHLQDALLVFYSWLRLPNCLGEQNIQYPLTFLLWIPWMVLKISSIFGHSMT